MIKFVNSTLYIQDALPHYRLHENTCVYVRHAANRHIHVHLIVTDLFTKTIFIETKDSDYKQ